MEETRLLPVEISDDEWKIRVDQLVSISGQIRKLEDEKKRSAAEIKTQIDSCKAQEEDIREVVRTHKAKRSVKCTWQANYVNKEMLLYRDDTVDIVERRPMTDSELQMELNLKRRKTDVLDEEDTIETETENQN